MRLCDVIVCFHIDAIYGCGRGDSDGGLGGDDSFGVAGEFEEGFGVVCVQDGILGIERDSTHE